MSPKKPGVLEPLRVRIRRLQFIVGLGLLSQVLGSVVSVGLAYRLVQRIQDLPWFLQLFVRVPLQNLWVLGALPLLCYGAARILELRPLPTALGAALSGELFVLALNFAWGGLDGLWTGWLLGALQVLALAAGVFLSYRAVVSGRAAAGRAAAKAQAHAEARKVEYQEFLREAERGAEKTAQREAERAVAASAGGAPAAPSEPATPEAASTEPPGESKAPSAGS